MRLTLVLALCFCAGVLNAVVIQVGTGTLINQSLPIEPARTYSYGQQLYYPNEIGTTGNISSLGFQYSVAGNIFYPNNNLWKVWLGHTQRSHMQSFVPLDSLTLVYDGMLGTGDFSGGLPGQGWLSITLQSAFFYNGTDKLIVAVDENAPGSSSTGDDFLCSASPSEQRGIVYWSMTVNPDPAAPPTEGNQLCNAFPNLRLDITPFILTPIQPIPADQATGVSINTSLQWLSNATSFDVWLGNNAQNLDLVAEGITSTTWFPSEPLQMLHTYFWQVAAHHLSQDYLSPLWRFTTMGEGISPPINLFAYFNTDHVQLQWDPPVQGDPVLYRIYRDGMFFATSSPEEYQDFEIQPGQTHFYYLRAENALGELSETSNTVTVNIPGDIANLIVMQDFESCTPFSPIIPNWQNIDGDGHPTWTWTNIDYPLEGTALAWLSFFPAQTTPPLSGVTAHTGGGMGLSMSSTVPPSADWLISPRVNLGNASQFSFWARSQTADYGLERLKAYISTTDDQPGSFVQINPDNWLSVPVDWTQYTYDLGDHMNEDVYLALESVSWDAFALWLDDIVITGEGGYVSNDDAVEEQTSWRIHPNPSKGDFSLRNTSKAPFDLSIFDLRGRLLFSSKNLASFNSIDQHLVLSSGIYLCRISQSGKEYLQRLAVIK
jgi:hypothetical protein